MTLSDDALTADANLTHIGKQHANIAQLETQLGELLTDLAAREERETDLRIELSKARERKDAVQQILERIAQATADQGALFFTPEGHDDWDAAIEWLTKHISLTPEQSMREQHAEVVNDWRRHARECEQRERVAQTDAAEWEALYTAALVDLHRARAALEQIRDCEGMYEWLDKRHAAGLGVVDLDWVASVAGEALKASDPTGAVSLLTELEAARPLIAFVRDNADCPTSVLNQRLAELQAAYDAAVEARRE